MNDDLGNFPTPHSSPTPITQKSTIDDLRPNTYTPPAFEPTPDEIPSPASVTTTSTPKPDELPPVNNAPASPDKIDEIIFPELEATPTPPKPESNEPIMATTPPASNSGSGTLLTIALLLIAGVGISGSVFLYSQSSALKSQLTDITQTLEQQRAIVTPSPTPSIIDIPTPTPTTEATESTKIFITPTATPTASITSKEFIPLALAPQALKVAIKHEPNAQLILIKAENATNSTTSLIKYFFRSSLTTKKYFYVSINSLNESEINDNAIYVNPDNNIPSLNDQVLGNSLGIDFKEAYQIATSLCTSDCKNVSVNAQFIKSGTNTIWQLTLDPAGKKSIVQINSQTKEVLFKSSGI